MTNIFDWARTHFRHQKPRRIRLENCSIELEQKFREIAVVHYSVGGQELTLGAEWLGWGAGQTMYLSLIIPEEIRFAETGPEIPSEQVTVIAGRIFEGLKQSRHSESDTATGSTHCIATGVPGSDTVSRSREMRSLGWELTFDRLKGTMQQTRIPGEFRKLNGEELARMAEHLSKAAECIRGYRTRYKVLCQSSSLPVP